ncbi:MAG: hypothetical protein AAGG72_06775, partial [Pseudomonadota bacterium]
MAKWRFGAQYRVDDYSVKAVKAAQAISGQSMHRRSIAAFLGCFAVVGLSVAAPVHAASTLETVKTRGEVQCGVNTGLAG